MTHAVYRFYYGMRQIFNKFYMTCRVGEARATRRVACTAHRIWFPLKVDIIDKKNFEEDENPQAITFVVEGVTAKFMNTLRRIILSQIPVMAIEDVIFIENSSPLFDEIIAHRLGLIPLKTDLEYYNLPKDCSCGGLGCTLCQVDFHLEKQVTEPTIIYSSAMKSTDPKVYPVTGKIPIVKLEKNMSLVFEAYARLGTGREHAKFQAVSTTAYRHYPDIEIAKTWKSKKEVEEAIQGCPRHLFEHAGGKKAPTLVDDWWKECTLCKECEIHSDGKIKVSPVKDKYIMFIESTGALPVKVILEKAVEIFKAKLSEMETQSQELELE